MLSDEDEGAWNLLRKWFQSSAVISAQTVGPSCSAFSMKAGLITHLSPTLMRLQGEGGESFELDMSDASFENLVTSEMQEETKLRRRFPESVQVSADLETLFLSGPIEIKG